MNRSLVSKTISVAGVLTTIFTLISIYAFGAIHSEVGSPSEPDAIMKTQALVYRFGVGSDPHYGFSSNPTGARDIAFLSALGSESVQRLFINGDIVHNNASWWAPWKVPYDASGLTYHVMRGNHDAEIVTGDPPADFMVAFGMASLWYNVTVGNIAWIVLDAAQASPPSGINATQIQYLSDALTYYSTKLCFVMLHESQRKLAYPAAEADNFAFHEVVKAHSNHLGGVIVGHAHHYSNLAFVYNVDSVRYIYAGTTGCSDANSNYYSYLIVNVYLEDATWTVDIARKDTSTGSTVYGTTDSFSPSLGSSPIWNASSEPALASNATNWINGVPEAGETAIFNATSIKNCTWDIDIGNSIYIMTGFTGYVNQSVATTFKDFSIVSGNYKPLVTLRTNITGNALMSGTRIAANIFRMVMTGSYKVWSFPENTPAMMEVIISGNINLKQSQYISSIGYWCNITGTLVIDSAIRLTVYPCQNTIISGTVTGLGSWITQGQLRYDASSGNKLIPTYTGTLNCALRLQAETSKTFTLSSDLRIGGPLLVRRSSDVSGSQIITFVTTGYDVYAGGIYLWIGGSWVPGITNITCSGNWDCRNGTFDYNETTVFLNRNDTYANLDSGEAFVHLYVGADDIRLVTDTVHTVLFSNDSLSLTMTPTSGNVSVTFDWPVDSISTELETVVATWSQVCTDTVTYEASNLNSRYNYHVLLDDDVIARDDGPSIAFASASNGTLTISVYYTTTVNSLVDLTFTMFILGIVISVIGVSIMPLRNPKNRTAERMVPLMMKSLVFIIISLALVTIVRAVIIG